MTEVQKWQISSEQDGQRLDNYLLSRLKGAPRTLVYRIIRSGEVRVNRGRVRPEYRVKDGDEIRIPPLRLAQRDDTPLHLGADFSRHLNERIIYEADGLIVLDKPQGMAVHGGSGIQLGVIEAMRSLRPNYRFLELVHRIDRDTSGLLLMAYQRSALLKAQEALRQGSVVKKYQAILNGTMLQPKVYVEHPLHKYNLASGEMRVRVDVQGKPAQSEFERIWSRQGLTGASVRIFTGRTHQIRVHALSQGMPIVGDEKYGAKVPGPLWQRQGFRRLFLHAATLELPWQDGMMTFEAPLDGAMQELWDKGLHNQLDDLIQ